MIGSKSVVPLVSQPKPGSFITTFSGAKPQHAQVRVEALRDYLVGLPVSTWPRGPMIMLSPTDDTTDWHAVPRNLEEARRICHSLGLDVEITPADDEIYTPTTDAIRRLNEEQYSLVHEGRARCKSILVSCATRRIRPACVTAISRHKGYVEAFLRSRKANTT
jgi:hypothetical protein